MVTILGILAMGAMPAKDEKDRDERVQGNCGADRRKDVDWEDPRGFEVVMAIVSWVCAHQRVEGSHGLFPFSPLLQLPLACFR
jgi:hypothetical protein